MASSSTTYSVVDERREIRKTTHMIVQGKHLQPDWMAIRTEMAPILEKRRAQVEKWAV